MKKAIFLSAVLVLLTTINSYAYNHGETAPPFEFVSKNGTAISVGDDAEKVLASLGMTQNKGKVGRGGENEAWYYVYSDFTLYTLKEGRNETVTGIEVTTGSIPTQEGLRIGDTYDNMVTFYDFSYSQSGNTYTYERGNSIIQFILDAWNNIISILYN